MTGFLQRLADWGSAMPAVIAYQKGHGLNPLSEEQVNDKLGALTVSVLGAVAFAERFGKARSSGDPGRVCGHSRHVERMTPPTPCIAGRKNSDRSL
jgi:hypothetical protein